MKININNKTESYIQFRLMSELEDLGYLVMPEVSFDLFDKYQKGRCKKLRVDIVVHDDEGTVYCVIEVKRKEKALGERQAFKYKCLENKGFEFFMCGGFDDIERVVECVKNSKAKPANKVSFLFKKKNKRNWDKETTNKSAK